MHIAVLTRQSAVTWAVLLVLACTPNSAVQPHRFTPQVPLLQQRANAEKCGPQAPWAALYTKIEEDLAHWAPLNTSATQHQGITCQMIDALIDNADSIWPWRRVAFLFQGGEPFIISDPSWPTAAGHHRALAAAHVMLMVGLSRLYGAAIPDVAFVVATSDGPSITLPDPGDPTAAPLPLFRFCKTTQHADILVPDIHFHTRAFTRTFLDPAVQQSLPAWSARKPRLFGRFSPYQRFFYAGNNSTYKAGFKGVALCPPPGAATSRSGTCPVRQVFMQWAAKKRVHHGIRLDVASQPRKSMPHHARLKYLLHLDGQTCSSRLEQLLALGSLVIKEDSGYTAFYHHLIKPYQHYLPFWRQGPEEVLEVLDWAKQYDNRSQDIAAAGQAFTRVFLHQQALSCYWLQLLKSYARLLSFTPGVAGSSCNYRWRVPAAQWLAEGPGARIVQQYKLSVEVE